jgi:hypothetical protein
MDRSAAPDFDILDCLPRLPPRRHDLDIAHSVSGAKLGRCRSALDRRRMDSGICDSGALPGELSLPEMPPPIFLELVVAQCLRPEMHALQIAPLEQSYGTGPDF